MEHLAWYELLLLFFAASFLGWVLETAAADIKQKKFVNRGLVTGPFCVMYGITTVLLTVGLGELRGIWLFLFSAIYATVVEWIGGHLIERLFHQRWWVIPGKRELGRLYLPGCFCVLGCSGICDGDLGK